MTPKWYATLRYPKMHPHTKIGIPASKNIDDMHQTRSPHSIPITLYWARQHRHFCTLKAQPDGGTPTRQWAGHPGLNTHGNRYTLYARKFQGCASELHIHPPIASPLLSTGPDYIAISKSPTRRVFLMFVLFFMTGKNLECATFES